LAAPPAGSPGSVGYGSVMQFKRDLPERASKKGRLVARAFKSLQKKGRELPPAL